MEEAETTWKRSGPLARTDHRPWPLPRRPWVMAMRWSDLLFLHRPAPAAELRALVPPALELDTFGGTAWLGVVPFGMSRVRARGLPPLPGLSRFPETNLRTYVVRDGKPGVWFFSLDAANRVAVRAARRFFRLPYFDARMSIEREGEAVRYRTERTHRGAPPAAWAGRYAPAGGVFRAEAGSLEEWLTERYALYASARDGAILRCDVHHAPWPLQRAEVEVERDGLFAQIGVEPGAERHLLFARRQDVVAWLPREAGGEP